MTRLERLHQELAEREYRNRDDRVGVTVGRAAQMLRMKRQAVLQYVHAGELHGEWIEGAVVRRCPTRQLVLRKGEVRRFRQALEERGRRRVVVAAGPQLALPLRPAPVAAAATQPASWRFARFKPVMIRAGLRGEAKESLVDRQVKASEKPKVSGRVA